VVVVCLATSVSPVRQLALGCCNGFLPLTRIQKFGSALLVSDMIVVSLTVIHSSFFFLLGAGFRGMRADKLVDVTVRSQVFGNFEALLSEAGADSVTLGLGRVVACVKLSARLFGSIEQLRAVVFVLVGFLLEFGNNAVAWATTSHFGASDLSRSTVDVKGPFFADTSDSVSERPSGGASVGSGNAAEQFTSTRSKHMKTSTVRLSAATNSLAANKHRYMIAGFAAQFGRNFAREDFVPDAPGQLTRRHTVSAASQLCGSARHTFNSVQRASVFGSDPAAAAL
jgi:hypothetical protein